MTTKMKMKRKTRMKLTRLPTFFRNSWMKMAFLPHRLEMLLRSIQRRTEIPTCKIGLALLMDCTNMVLSELWITRRDTWASPIRGNSSWPSRRENQTRHGITRIPLGTTCRSINECCLRPPVVRPCITLTVRS